MRVGRSSAPQGARRAREAYRSAPGSRRQMREAFPARRPDLAGGVVVFQGGVAFAAAQGPWEVFRSMAHEGGGPARHSRLCAPWARGTAARPAPRAHRLSVVSFPFPALIKHAFVPGGRPVLLSSPLAAVFYLQTRIIQLLFSPAASTVYLLPPIIHRSTCLSIYMHRAEHAYQCVCLCCRHCVVIFSSSP